MGAICLAAVLALAPAGPALAHGTYGEDLLAGSLRHYPAVLGLRILATDRSGAAIALAEGDFGQGLAILLPLANAMGEPVGELTVQCRCSAGQARRVAAHLARRILTAEGLSEPAPFVAGAQTAPAAQAIVEREVDRHPALVTLAMHVARPQGANAIIASSFGRIGKAADKDDAHVIADGAILREVTNGG
ncbi:MAG TPA: hypothetical protein VFF98_09490, partial [Novosphingobium sp.]|nr:hypothetical protein [Novosphingobium sp.]